MLPQEVKEPLLVVGADGLLGGRLFQRWATQGRIVSGTCLPHLCQDPRHVPLDLAGSVEAWTPPQANASVVICAAITNQDQCRRNPETTRHVNVTQTLALIRRLVELGCFVTFISSNMVFDGSKPLRLPNEPTSPKTEYGRQKAEVEAALTEFPDHVAIVRLTKVIHGGLPIIRNWIKSLTEGKAITPFSDYLCSPISLEQTIEIISRVTEQRSPGIWHASASEDLSYAQMAQILAVRQKCAVELVRSTPAPTGLLEHLPSFTTLDATRAATELHIEFLSAKAVMQSI